MKNKIIKKIFLQKKHWRYKYLFSITTDEIEKIWIKEFIKIYLSLQNSKEKREEIKYFRLKSNFKEYFSTNKEKILIQIDSNYTKTQLEILLQLHSILKNINYIYNLDLDNKKNILKELKSLEKLNPTLYIKSKYQKSNLSWIQNNLKIFYDKEILLSLDKIQKQSDLNHEILFEIIDTLKNNQSHINLDFIRLESAYKKLYAIWPKEFHLDLFEYCNANCDFCWTNWPWFLTNRNDNDNSHKITFSAKQYLNLFQNISKAHTETLALWITWEPFLHPEIKQILKWLKDIDIKIWFLTNWYKLLENIDLITQTDNIKHFYINISSGNFKSFQITRPWDNFDNFLNTWKAIKKIREQKPEILIRCLYVITPQNICWINDFIKLTIRNNISEIELKRVVPYEFSHQKFHFTEKDIEEIFEIVDKNKSYFKENNITINQNFNYIKKDFQKALKNIQYPEADLVDKRKLKPATNNCYNPYFYISLFRNTAFSCWKFIWKIWKLPQFDLYKLLFEENEIKNIIAWAENLEEFLWTDKRKKKCSRCHHMDINEMVKSYVEIKKIEL